MDVLLHGYDVNRPTWFYLSTLLIVAVFFRFNRLWSLRNLDLLLLLLGSPGLILVGAVDEGVQRLGHAWLFAFAGIWLVRMFADLFLQRRPYLGQNLNDQGLTFLCCAAFAFLMVQAVTTRTSIKQTAAQQAQAAAALEHVADNSFTTKGTGSSSILDQTDAQAEQPQPPVETVAANAGTSKDESATALNAPPATSLITAILGIFFDDLTARILAILSHVAVISGLWFVGRNLFGDSGHGLAMGTLYLLVPCTAYNVGEFNHVLPAAFIVWAVVCFRKPVIAGALLGLACGTMLFPVVLFPLWMAFYGRKGALRFAGSLIGVGVLLFGLLLLIAADRQLFLQQALAPIDLAFLDVTNMDTAQGFWKDNGILSMYRLPVMVAYLIMVVCMTIWPRERSLETLLSQSAAAILGTQLWYTDRGGVYLLWYLPLVLIVMFRPRLVHLVPFRGEIADENLANAPRPGGTTRTGMTASQRLQLFR